MPTKPVGNAMAQTGMHGCLQPQKSPSTALPIPEAGSLLIKYSETSRFQAYYALTVMPATIMSNALYNTVAPT
jgi:hypothetical protein